MFFTCKYAEMKRILYTRIRLNCLKHIVSIARKMCSRPTTNVRIQYEMEKKPVAASTLYKYTHLISLMCDDDGDVAAAAAAGSVYGFVVCAYIFSARK